MSHLLQGSTEPLCERYDAALLDLDGVVYIGAAAVPGAPEHLAAARAAGMQLGFVTNNASRPPATVAEHLRSLGIQAALDDVVTSAQAAAGVLADRLPAGSPVAVLGADALRDEVGGVGLRPVSVEDDAEALVTGYGPDVLWREVMRAAVRVRDGLWWVASNTDSTIPTDFGQAPGHGVLVETLSRFSGRRPAVAGKPEGPLLHTTRDRLAAQRPLMVGDRLDTDIAGANQAGFDSMLVLTGVTGLPELVRAPSGMRPSYLATDLGGLLEPQPEPEHLRGGFEVGRWRSWVEDGELRVEPRADAEASGPGEDDWWRAVAVAAWEHLDQEHSPAAVDDLVPPPATVRSDR